MPLAERHVVTCFLLRRSPAGDQILLVRRSAAVSTYPGRWAGISGSVDTTPEAQALTEIAEETGLTPPAIRLLGRGAPLTVDDPALGRRWVVHPYLFLVETPAAVRLDWEHTEGRWVTPAELAGYPTVPGLRDALARVYPPSIATDAAGGSTLDAAIAAIIDGYREVHQRFRDMLGALDPALLHRRPAPETNSIAVLIHHTLGSERQVARLVAGLPASRDRAAEFRITAADLDLAGLRAEIDAADALLDELAPRLTPERLATMIERPDRGPRTGIGWLVDNYGHAREHLAQVELTRQWLAHQASAAGDRPS
jgi:ADP-ribose pyrophosphatase YjhB (NUDIX family)